MSSSQKYKHLKLVQCMYRILMYSNYNLHFLPMLSYFNSPGFDDSGLLNTLVGFTAPFFFFYAPFKRQCKDIYHLKLPGTWNHCMFINILIKHFLFSIYLSWPYILLPVFLTKIEWISMLNLYFVYQHRVDRVVTKHISDCSLFRIKIIWQY